MDNATLLEIVNRVDEFIENQKEVRLKWLLHYCDTHGIVNGCRVLRDGKEFQVVINQGNPPRGWKGNGSFRVNVLAYPIKKDGNVSAIGAAHLYVDDVTVVTK